MALQGALTLDNGISLSNAYLIIPSIFCNLLDDDLFVVLNVSIYKDSSAYSNGNPEVSVMSHKCIGTDFNTYFSESVLDDAGKTLISQSYVYLLTLPAYSEMSQV